MLKNERHSLQSMKINIPKADLPYLFLDAILIAKRLNIRYIWIDSLCIIQDCLKDWQMHASLMDQIYGNSFLNISATGATDSNGRCFFERIPAHIHPLKLRTNWVPQPSDTWELTESDLWANGVANTPLNLRGWVLQERLLAGRVLHCGKDQSYWECQELTACETFSDGIPSSLEYMRVGKGLDPAELGALQRRHFPVHLSQYDPYLVWSKIINLYSCCQLSKPGDKLIAISGLAKYMQRILDDEYVAGLWRRYLGYELFWIVCFEVKRPASGPTVYRAPTWSWASLDAKVHASRFPGANLNPLEVLEAQVQSCNGDQTGQIATGYIKVRGQLSRIDLTDLTALRGRNFDFMARCEHSDCAEQHKHVVFYDILQQTYSENYYSISTPLHFRTGEAWANSLLLIYNGPEKRTYSRCGVIMSSYYERSKSTGSEILKAYAETLSERRKDLPHDEFESGKGYTITII